MLRSSKVRFGAIGFAILASACTAACTGVVGDSQDDSTGTSDADLRRWHHYYEDSGKPVEKTSPDAGATTNEDAGSTTTKTDAGSTTPKPDAGSTMTETDAGSTTKPDSGTTMTPPSGGCGGTVTGSSMAQAGPITITSGGTYTGNWLGTTSTPAVTVKTTDPVTITQSLIQGKGTLIEVAVNGAQLTITHNIGTALNPNVKGTAPGQFLDVIGAKALDVEHNLIQNAGGYVFDVESFTGNGSGSQTIKILYNSIQNVNGRYSDGNGGYQVDGQDTPHAIILGYNQGIAGIEIAWNQIVNQAGQSYVDDVINMYESSGTAASPILIHDNYEDGLYSFDPNGTYDSGCGIITDGNTSPETGFVSVYDNIVLNTSNGGISIAAGHDVHMYGNTVLSTGKLADGTSIYGQNLGIAGWDQMTGGSSSTYYNNSLYDNTVGWLQQPNTEFNTGSSAAYNNIWTPSLDASSVYGNTSVTVTAASVAAQAGVWQAKLTSHSACVGP